MQTTVANSELRHGKALSSIETAKATEAWFTPGRFAVFLATLVFATFPTVLLGTKTLIFRDFSLFSYPVAHFHRECFWRGELPLWNPLNHCGVPFLAQWNTITLYPGSLIYLLFPLTWSLPFFCLTHLFWGGLGMYLLALAWSNNRFAAAAAGVIFSFSGLMLNFLIWPSHVATFAWTPWVLWLMPEGWRQGGSRLCWGVLAGSLQMLAGGPETILLTWIFLCILALGDLAHSRGTRVRLVLRFGAGILLVASVCAVQLLPFLELMSVSQRDRAYGSTSHGWEMPVWGWMNFLVPLFRTSPVSQGVYLQNGQYWTSSYYAGIGTVFLGAVALRHVRSWRLRVAAVCCLIGAVLAWGEGSVFYSALKLCFPGLGFVRYPVKFVIIVMALAPLLAAAGLDALRTQRTRPGLFEWCCLGAMLLMIGTTVALDWHCTPEDMRTPLLWNAITRSAFLLGIFALLYVRFDRSRFLRATAPFLLPGVIWLDLATHVPSQNPTARPEVYSNSAGLEVAGLKSRVFLTPADRTRLDHRWLASVEDNFRQHRAYSRPNVNLLDGVPEVDGFFSLVSRESHEITTLPYRNPELNLDHLLDFMGAAEIDHGLEATLRPTAAPILTIGQQPVFIDDASAAKAIKANTDLRPVVFLPETARDAVSGTAAPEAKVLNWQMGRESITAEVESPGPALLVAAQSFYPGWRALVDGTEARIWRANYCFQAVQVPGGRHTIRFVYRERTLLPGLVLSCLGLVAAGIVARTGKAGRCKQSANTV
jgi:hypothetical protein